MSHQNLRHASRPSGPPFPAFSVSAGSGQRRPAGHEPGWRAWRALAAVLLGIAAGTGLLRLLNPPAERN